MPEIDPIIKPHSITPSHKDKNGKGFIVTFKIDPNKISQVPRKSVYKKCLANDPTFIGDSYWVVRLTLDEKGLCLKLHKVDQESILFLHEVPMFLLEYSDDKLFVGGYPAHMYLVFDWETVKFIAEPNLANTFKTYAFPIPEFNEKTNPFIVVLGEASLNILNVNSCQHKPLINQEMNTGYPGL